MFKAYTSWMAAGVMAAGCCFGAVAEQKSIVQTAIDAGTFNTLVAAVQAADLVEALEGAGPFTVFAPSDQAFAKLPAGTVEGLLENKEKLTSILLYHVVPGKVMAKDAMKLTTAKTLLGQDLAITAGEGVQVGGANVVSTDIACTNGVIHVVDSVIMPKDIVGIAAGSADFSTLVAAVKAAGLVETLQGDGPFTVFAPTNAAFAKIPAATLEDLLKPENKAKLQSILTYHVVPGKVMAQDVVGMKSAKTVEGGKVNISAKNGTVKINDATVTATDIVALNGVIHVIDTVLMP